MRNWIWIALHCVVLLVPGVALAIHAPDARLFGSEFKTELPTWSFRGWTEEKVQKEFQAWFESHLGFRGAMVRTDNTVFYASTGEAKPEASVKRGDDDTLFIGEDLQYGANRKADLPSPVALTEMANVVSDVQRRLEKIGKRLVVVISPSKTSLYPKEVPSEWRRGESPSANSDRSYEMLRGALEKSGAQFVDGRAFLNKTPDERDVLFPRTARHWSQVGACRVLREASRPGAWTEPSCDYTFRAIDPIEIVHADFDLFELLNVWHLPGNRLAQGIYLTETRQASERPKALFVGTSFSFMLIDASRTFLRPEKFFYYNTTVYDATVAPAQPIEKVDPRSPNWERYVLDKDLYVVEILEIWPHADGVKDFLSELRQRL